MHRFTSHIRRPIHRMGAEQYMLVTLLSFAASVTLTRAFLALTGYPQLAGGDLHIAHALWGGLLLYIAALLPLIYANRWVYMAGAILTGTGVGLFIDEVGKFITQSNDYFYPLAAPIVYAFFLLSVLLYQRIRRRRPSRSVRAELFQVFEAMEEVLEQDLDERERNELEARLRYVAEHAGDRAELKLLANDLLQVLRYESLVLAPRRLGPVERCALQWQAFEARWVTRRRIKLTLATAMVALGMLPLARAALGLVLIAGVVLTAAEGGPLTLTPEHLGVLLEHVQRVLSSSFFWIMNVLLELAVGLLLLFSAGLLLTGHEDPGTALGSLGLVLALTAVNLLVFYTDQFSAVFTALVQLGVLTGLSYYRSRYVAVPEAGPVAAEPVVERTGEGLAE